MYKTIDLARVTGGKFIGEIDISSKDWETRTCWVHYAEVCVNYKTVASAKIAYSGRTWEEYPHQVTIYQALRDYVHSVTGIDPISRICKRDEKQMKSAAAENRRLERVAAHDFAVELYRRLKGIVDGTLTYEDIEKAEPVRSVA